jgi:hypothetical protein
MSDDLFSYAAQLGPKRPPLDAPVPFACHARRAGGQLAGHEAVTSWGWYAGQ